MPALEYLSIDKPEPTAPVLSDEEIVAALRTSTAEPDVDDSTDLDIDNVEPIPVTTSQAITSLATVTRYFEQQESTSESELSLLSTMMSRLLEIKRKGAAQRKITDFFSAPRPCSDLVLIPSFSSYSRTNFIGTLVFFLLSR